jgi:hypothetical protein
MIEPVPSDFLRSRPIVQYRRRGVRTGRRKGTTEDGRIETLEPSLRRFVNCPVAMNLLCLSLGGVCVRACACVRACVCVCVHLLERGGLGHLDLVLSISLDWCCKFAVEGEDKLQSIKTGPAHLKKPSLWSTCPPSQPLPNQKLYRESPKKQK